MSDPHAEANVSSEAPAPLEACNDATFRGNLEEFGERAARLCQLLRSRRISSESCFRALTQLWLQVARSRAAADRIGRTEEPPGKDDKQESQVR